MFAGKGYRLHRLRLPVVLLAVVIAGIMASGAAFMIWQARQSTLAEAHAAYRGTARVLSRHVFHVVRSSEVLLAQMLEELRRQGGIKAVRGDGAALHDSLQQLMLPLNEVVVAAIIDGGGNLVASNQVHPPIPTLYTDRAWFQAHQWGQDFVIGEPVVSRVTGKAMLPISRAMRGPSGKLEAVALVGIELEYLEKLFSEVHTEDGRAVTLFRSDSILIARNPPGPTGKRFPAAEAVQRSQTEATGSIIARNSAVDGLDRLNAWDRIRDYPMVVVVGQSLETLLAPWRTFALQVIGMLVVMVGALAVACRYVLTAIRREETSLATVEEARTRAESIARELSRANQSLASVLAAAPEGIIGMDSGHRIIFANDAALHLLGHDRAEAIGAGLHELAHHHRADGSEYPEDDCAMRRGLEAEPLCTVADEVFWRKDGTSFPVEYTAGRLEMADGTHGCVVVFHDISARRRMEEELKRSNADLEQFAYAVSHDLQEPLRTISGFVGLLKRCYSDSLPAEGIEFIDMAVDGVKRMTGMIDDLLAYSRIGRTDISAAPVDLTSCATRARDSLMAAIDETGTTVEIAALPVVTAIESQMVGLFQNLLGNAIKYAAEGRAPHVAITTRREGGNWVVRIADNGIGIAVNDRDRVFQVFQRLHRRGISGSGVGLALCRRIAERHRGTITIEDREDGQPGSVFVLRLPALPAN
ncbi:MAG: ATP-binding protein [Bacteroidota bacterium]